MRTGKLNPRSYADGLEAMQTEIIGESMTRQDHNVNINAIYAKTQRGEIVLASSVMPKFDDFSHVDSYDVMLESIMEAEEAFLQLPAIEREAYGHDPANYYQQKYDEASASLKDKKDKEAWEKKKADKEKAISDAKALLSKEKPNSD